MDDSSGWNDASPDSGRTFGRGRPIDDGWNNSENNFDDWSGQSRSPRGGGRSGRGVRGRRERGGGDHDNNGFWRHGNDEKNGFGGGGYQNHRGGRGTRGDGARSRKDSNQDEGWGGSPEANDNGFGGDSNDNGDDFYGETSRGRGRGSRGSGRGRGRGRGGIGGGGDSEYGGGDNGEVEKPRERYIPPDPTTDEAEMFGSGNTTGINFDKYDDISVKVTGENIPQPIANFEDSGLRPYLLANVKRSGYTKPTPIQKNAIPIIMGGRDVMACAQTGSGKTAAFLLPILHALISDPVDIIVDSTHCEPQAVVISPTRELTIQIYEECRKFSHGSIMKAVVAYGGTAVYHQAKQLMNGCHILVATPGRLMDFVGSGKITFSSVRFVVLDEADRMLDMGFFPEMEKVLGHETMVPTGERQTLMFSATFPEQIQYLAGKFLSDYLFITIGIVGGACSDVIQNFYQVDKFNKRAKLLEIFQEEGADRTLVFVETKRTADFLATVLCEADFRTTSIHGDRLQREREEALGDFKRGRRDILVATGVAARGLDIKNVKHVINFDLPKGIDEYVHRIGRTGRVGNSGRATSFYDGGQDASLARDLIKILRQADQPVPDWLLRDENAGSSAAGFRNSRFGGRDVRGDDFGTTTNDAAPQQPEIEEDW